MSASASELPRKQRRWRSPHGEAWADARVHLCVPGTMQAEILRLTASTFDLFGRGFAGAGTIADWALKSDRAVRRTIGQLVDRGLLIIRKEGRRTWIIARHWFIGDPADRRLAPVLESAKSDSESAKPDSESAYEDKYQHTEEQSSKSTFYHKSNSTSTRVRGENRDFFERDDRSPPAAAHTHDGFVSEGPASELPDSPPYDPDSEPVWVDLGEFEGQPARPRTIERDPPEQPRGPRSDDRGPREEPRRPAPPATPRNPPETSRQASSRSDELDPEAMRKVWNKAVEGTPIKPCRELDRTRIRNLRTVAQTCHQRMEAWEAICQYVANNRKFRGEAYAGGYPASFAQITGSPHNWPLEILEDIDARTREYEAQCEAQGIYNPHAQPEPEPEPMPPRSARPRPIDDREATNEPELPTLNRAQIIAIDPMQAGILGGEKEMNDPVMEARKCAWVVRMMAECGLLPGHKGSGLVVNGS